VRTKRDATEGYGRAMKVSVAVFAASGALVAASLAFGASSFSDSAGDDNAAPDITSVQVSESADRIVTIVVAIANYEALPTDSWFNVWFDVDSNQSTGYAGDEMLVRYVATGTVELYEWDGVAMASRPATGLTGSFAARTLTLTVPTATLGPDSSFGVLAIGSRRQQIIQAQFVASDFAPENGRVEFTGATPATLVDRGDDQDAAPDIAGVRVVDRKDGWISVAVTTPNYATLSGASALWVAVDSDNRAATGDVDAASELQVRYVRGEATLERWDPSNGGWVPVLEPGLVRARNSGNVVTVDLRRSVLGKTKRFGFAVTTAAFDAESGVVLALDLAPNSGGFYRYAFANVAFSLAATRLFATPSEPRAGQSFAVNLSVRRSDTNRAITSGTVTCRGSIRGTRLRGSGRVVGGRGRCVFGIPKSGAGGRLRGTITVRVDGRTVSRAFAYVVR
jgi:hypothetical protein